MLKKITKRNCAFTVALCFYVTICVSCSPDQGAEGKNKVALFTSLEESPYQVELKIFRLPETANIMNHFSYSLKMGKDGFLYFGVGDNQQNGHLFRFDPVTERITDLGNFKDALTKEIYESGNYGKFHVGPYQDFDGTVYFASHPREWWDGEHSGRLFKYIEGKGTFDIGPMPNNYGAYFMYGDDKYGKLYLANRDSHFYVYDLKTGIWTDKGRFTSKAPFISLTDRSGKLYLYGYDGKGDWTTGPPTITRYDPALNTLSTSKNAPPTPWIGAVSPDHDIAYTTNYRKAEMFRWRLSDWPDYQVEELGRIDPEGRPVYSNNFSMAPDKKRLVLAGSILTSKWVFWKANLHGLWVYDIESGKKHLAANLGEVLSESFDINVKKQKFFLTNANTVDQNGWIYIGVHTLPPNPESSARLMALRIHQKAFPSPS